MYDGQRPSSVNVLSANPESGTFVFPVYLGERNVLMLKGFDVCKIASADISSSSAQMALKFYSDNFSAIYGLRASAGNVFQVEYSAYDNIQNLQRAASFFDEECDLKRVLFFSSGKKELDLSSQNTRDVFDVFGLSVPEAKSYRDFGAVVQMLRIFPDGACLNDVMFLPYELICAFPKE